MHAMTSTQSAKPLVEAVLSEHADHRGLLHGAAALHLMGKAAFGCAARRAGCDVIMAKADGIEFRRPVPVDAAIDIRADIVFQGRSSMTVVVEITFDGPADHRRIPPICGRFMMVAVGADGLPIPISTSATLAI